MAMPIPGKKYVVKGDPHKVRIQVTRVERGKIPAWGGPVDVEICMLDLYPWQLGHEPLLGHPFPWGTIERFDEVHNECPS